MARRPEPLRPLRAWPPGNASSSRPRNPLLSGGLIGLLQPGKKTDVTLDLIAKDGKLYWGPVKLTELPPLTLTP